MKMNLPFLYLILFQVCIVNFFIHRHFQVASSLRFPRVDEDEDEDGDEFYEDVVEIREPPQKNATFPPYLFSSDLDFNFELSNKSISLGSWRGVKAHGSLAWPALSIAKPASFYVLPSLLSETEAFALLSRVKTVPLDEDPDSVDSAPTFEVYLERSGSFDGVRGIQGKPDSSDETIFASREAARSDLAAVARPIVAERIVPFVNAHYSEACGEKGCVVCHSLVRKYVDGERMTHPTHFDISALVTVVISLSHADDFSGGLYVSVGAGTEQSLSLKQGDAVVHQSNLLHGVRVGKGERWSWILWFKNAGDASQCDSVDLSQWDSLEAANGDPVAAFLVARRAKSNVVRAQWLKTSADAGFARAQNELGQLLREGANGVPRDMSLSRSLLTAAALAEEPEAIYNLGTLAASEGDIPRALLLFKKAALLGVPLAAFNVGVSFYTGKGGVERDLELASRWFDFAGGERALLLSAQIAMAQGRDDAKNRLMRASSAGSKEAKHLLMAMEAEIRMRMMKSDL